jgi:Flp pilus assembly protein TadG
MNFLRRFFYCQNGGAMLEAAIVLPVFLTLTAGMVDLGTRMFIAMEVNNAAQAGAANVVNNPTVFSVSNVQAAMTAAAGNLTVTAAPAPTLSDGVLTVTASYSCTIANQCVLIPWSGFGGPNTMTSTVTVRVQ